MGTDPTEYRRLKRPEEKTVTLSSGATFVLRRPKPYKLLSLLADLFERPLSPDESGAFVMKNIEKLSDILLPLVVASPAIKASTEEKGDGWLTVDELEPMDIIELLGEVLEFLGLMGRKADFMANFPRQSSPKP